VLTLEHQFDIIERMAGDLRDELMALLDVDIALLAPADRTKLMARIEQARARFESWTLSQLAAFDESGAWQLDAAYNAGNWLAGQTGTARADAGRRLKLANHLRQMPVTAHALAEGQITEAHARVLARGVANPRVRGAFVWAEPRLVARAKACTADELVHEVAAWIELNDQDGAEPKDPQHDTVSASQVGDRVKINADLGLDTGIPVLAALDERVNQLFHRDQKVAEINPTDGLGARTPGNRRAEALTELVLAGAGAESNPRRREPLFTVIIDEETFLYGTRREDTVCEQVGGAVVPIDIMVRWRAGARVEALVLDARRSVLHLGRSERYANREQRRALAIRDRGCAVPGCDRPPAFCDAHHVIWWEKFGPTDIDSLCLLCTHHHHLVHAGKLRVEMVGGVPRFFDSFDQLLEPGRHRPKVRAA